MSRNKADTERSPVWRKENLYHALPEGYDDDDDSDSEAALSSYTFHVSAPAPASPVSVGRYAFLLGVLPAALTTLLVLGLAPINVLLAGAYIATAFFLGTPSSQQVNNNNNIESQVVFLQNV